MPNTVRCPRCGQPQPDRGDTAIYYCEKCRGMFDSTPDEGGSHYDDPSKRLEREEERRAKAR